MRAIKAIAGITAAMAIVAAVPSYAGPDINGGSSWGGWTTKGLSNTLGLYGSGSTTDVYEVYTTVFSFNNHSVSGGAVGGGPTGGTRGFWRNAPPQDGLILPASASRGAVCTGAGGALCFSAPPIAGGRGLRADGAPARSVCRDHRVNRDQQVLEHKGLAGLPFEGAHAARTARDTPASPVIGGSGAGIDADQTG